MSDTDAVQIVPRYAPRLKPTPIPEALAFDLPTKCIAVNERWLSHILGVMEALDQPDTWIGTPEEILAARDQVNAIMAAWADECVGDCVTPDGDPPFRVLADGTIEQLQGGEWVEPNGDYEIPPVPAREELTANERRCLAAANAANILAQLYEAITDQYAEEINPQLGLAALVIAVGLLLFPVAPIVAGVVAFFGASFNLLYFLVDSLGSDLWDAEFTQKLTCILYDNAIDTAGVVTFDFEGVITDMGSATTIEYTFAEVKLFGQVDFLLRSIGAPGLNHAGTTTEILTADCEICSPGWCFEWDFTVSDGGWTADSGLGNYVPGVGWQSVISGSTPVFLLRKVFPTPNSLRDFEITYTQVGATNAVRRLFYHNGASYVGISILQVSSGGTAITTAVINDTTTVTLPNMVLNWSADATGSGLYTLTKITGRGDFDPNPFGSDNCIPD